MTECLRIRLRASGPWRIAPDSGVRDRSAVVFHSDALFSAVCSAMRQLDLLEEWLTATVRHPSTAQVRFSSMFPWQGNQFFLPAPRGAWPPAPSSKLYARAARFLPQAVASALFHGAPVHEDRWYVDAASECLLPSGARGAGSGPFRHALRTGAAVDRVEPGRTEVHRTGCIEFAANAGMWFVAEFFDRDVRREWEPRLTAALRLLSDSGFGGRRSIGWGQASIVDIVSGSLSDLVLGPPPKPPRLEAAQQAPASVAPLIAPEPGPVEEEGATSATEPTAEGTAEAEPAQLEPQSEAPGSGTADALPVVEQPAEPVAGADPEPPAGASFEAPSETTPLDAEPVSDVPLAAEPALALAEEASAELLAPAAEPESEPAVPAPQLPTAWWLLSLLTPAGSDTIDWQRGAYSLVNRSGRVESPQGWGLEKKAAPMVAEGSLLFAESEPVGAATDVAPDGFPHPVYRAGYAVAVPVPFRGVLP